jgi:hypothetical protein
MENKDNNKTKFVPEVNLKGDHRKKESNKKTDRKIKKNEWKSKNALKTIAGDLNVNTNIEPFLENGEPNFDYHLSENQKLFCEHYVNNGFNARKSYAAIYKNEKVMTNNNGAVKIMQNIYVIKYIQKLRTEIFNAFKVDREYIVQELIELISDAKINGLDGEGNIKDRNAWNMALRQLSKILGIEHTNVNINLNEYKLDFGGVEIPPTDIIEITTKEALSDNDEEEDED